MAPADRNLFDFHLELDGKEEDFGVEAPAFDALQAEDDLGRGPLEGLEAALGVLEGETHGGAGDGVETSAEETPVKRLMRGLLGGVEPAGADGDVRALVDGGHQEFGLFHGGGEVGVGEHDDLAGGLEEAVADGVALALVAWVLEETEARVFRHPTLDDRGCVVG